MCLQSSRKEINKFKADNAGKDVILVWKVYNLRCPNIYSHKLTLMSPFKFSQVNNHGVIKSDRHRKRLNWKHDRDYFYIAYGWTINHGIHVYTSRESAVMNCGGGQAVVCCHAKMSDFVAAETYYGKPWQAVFMKISISPRNYRRATNGK